MFAVCLNEYMMLHIFDFFYFLGQLSEENGDLKTMVRSNVLQSWKLEYYISVEDSVDDDKSISKSLQGADSPPFFLGQ